MRIIPAIDIIDGKCVRLTQGDYQRKNVYRENPLDVATEIEQAGIKHLHLVDLDGARSGKVINWEVIETLAAKTSLHIDFGGGIKTDDEIIRLFKLGVRQVNLGSIAVKNPAKVEEWLERFGREKIILSADVKDETIAISGWQQSTSMGLFDLLSSFISKGIQYVTCTDISTDGTLQGPNIELYKKIISAFPGMKLIASGGVGRMEDVIALKQTGVDGAIIGKALYEGKLKLEDLMTI